MSRRSKKGLCTRAVHAGEKHSGGNRPSAPDIVMSSTFVVDEEVSFSANNLDEDTPYVYTRWGNPTTDLLQASLADLENAEACLAFASGMSATTAILFSHLSSGDHMIVQNTNYPGTSEVARETLSRFGVSISAVDTTDLEAIRNSVRDETKMIWIETPSNPLLRVVDIAAVSEIAKECGALLVVDSTFATPIATRPIDLGADLVVHSLTKYIGGHGDAMGGSVSGSDELLGPLRSEGLSHYGGVISPFNSWLILRGIATLPLRMRAHQEAAMACAEFLEGHPKVELTVYPGLESHPQHALAKQQMDNFSGMISFRTSNPRALAERMMNELEVIHYAVSLGHHRSLIYLMQTTDLVETSYALTGEERDKFIDVAGEGLFRFSVGIEDPADLIEDLDRVLT